MKRSYFIFLILVLSTVGCSEQIKQYIGRSQEPPTSNLNPSIGSGSQKGYKVSPSAGVMSGGQVQAKYSISYSRLKLQGSQVDAQLAIQSRHTQ